MVLALSARTTEKTAKTITRGFPLFSFMASGVFPGRLRLLDLFFRRPRERQQKGAILGRLHIMRNALIQNEQFPGREIHHPLGQMEPDMAVKRVHRDSASRRMLIHARIRLHGDQHNAEIRVLYERLRTSSRGVLP